MGIKINLLKKHSKKSVKRHSKSRSLPKQYIISFLVICLIAFGLGYFSRPTEEQKQIHSRANKIFEFDRAHPKALSDREVVSLSVSLGFGNYQGAEFILRKLESQI